MSYCSRKGHFLEILIMMAGEGERFKELYNDLPKPLIPIDGKAMIERALESLGLEGRYHFVMRKDMSATYKQALQELLYLIKPGCHIHEVEGLTQGPVCSALVAKDLLDPNAELIVTNCDQIMEWQSSQFLEKIRSTQYEGLVVTYDTQKPINSYIKLNEKGLGVLVAEKEVISEYSLNGIHYFKTAQIFIKAAQSMIEKNIRVNGEFYVAPVYNELIRGGLRVGIHHIPADQHWAVGTPTDLEIYLKHRHRNEAV